MTHSTRSMLLTPQPAEVCPIYWIDTIGQNCNSFATNSICSTSHQMGDCSTRPFLRWVRAQGRSPDISAIPKNASGSVGISLKNSSGDKPGPSVKPRNVSLGRVTRMLGLPCTRAWLPYPETWHTWLDPYHWYHSQPKCAPSTRLIQLDNSFATNGICRTPHHTGMFGTRPF